MSTRTIKVDALARVEGEGALFVRLKDGAVSDVRLQIYEPPRFFEGLLRGRDFREAPDITARICGICPVAYQMSAVHAMERALGVVVDGPLRDLRTLLYCGEWVESHALHVTMLHLPDFLGFDDAIQLAKQSPDLVKESLVLKKAGNAIMRLLGGREIHPINVKVGGFYKTPRPKELLELRPALVAARDIAAMLVRKTAALDFPDLERDVPCVALQHESEYAMNEGRIVCESGLDIDASEWESHFSESQVPHSTALHASLAGVGSYLVGPVARYNLGFDRLSAAARAAAQAAGLPRTVRNPFMSIAVRSVELLHAVDTSIRIIDAYTEPPAPSIPVEVPARSPGDAPLVGTAATEAPRGLLFHRYELAADGAIVSARIVPPTSQNQAAIEDDLRAFVPRFAELPKPELTARCEQAVRNYDPCISCATHFLALDLERT